MTSLPTSDQRNAYVDAALALHGYALNPARVVAVAQQFERIASIAATMLDTDLPADSEPAPSFHP